VRATDTVGGCRQRRRKSSVMEYRHSSTRRCSSGTRRLRTIAACSDRVGHRKIQAGTKRAIEYRRAQSAFGFFQISQGQNPWPDALLKKMVTRRGLRKSRAGSASAAKAVWSFYSPTGSAGRPRPFSRPSPEASPPNPIGARYSFPFFLTGTTRRRAPCPLQSTQPPVPAVAAGPTGCRNMGGLASFGP